MGRVLIDSGNVPQADRIERIYEYLRQLYVGDLERLEAAFSQPRDRSYLRHAARILGLVEAKGNLLTAAGRHVAGSDPEDAYRLMGQAFENSVVGRAWLEWAKATSLSELRAADAHQFLSERTSSLSESTLERRASTLVSWLQVLQPHCRSRTSAPPVSIDVPRKQLSLLTSAPSADAAMGEQLAWPAPERFPHNEEGAKVESVILGDIVDSTHALIVAGYSSLDRLLALLERRAVGEGRIRLLLGSEPYPTERATFAASTNFHSEVWDYWYRRGISVLRSGAVLHAHELVTQGTVEVRTFPGRRRLHAKMYATDAAITLGSSNYTDSGLRLQSEANIRLPPEEGARHTEARALAEKLWERGADDREWFLALLDGLLRSVSWEEALGRACAELLDGEWTRRYAPPPDGASSRLWLHQRQGISQAAWILQNVGSVLVADPTGSGKTKMGAWIIRSAFDRHFRQGYLHDPHPLVVVPPQVAGNWDEALADTGIPLRVESHGQLSSQTASRNEALLRQIGRTELLAVDEAHNFIRKSERSKRLRLHYAENAVLFTATPINRSPRDLLAILELLGADQLDEQSFGSLLLLRKSNRLDANRQVEAMESARDSIRRFTVRRTKKQLDSIARAHPDAYKIGDRSARYPKHIARYFECGSTDQDDRIANQIYNLACEIQGVSRITGKLEAPRWIPEDAYLRRVVASARALARYHVMSTLRSSRAALVEHALGTDTAWVTFLGIDASGKKREPTGDCRASSLKKAERLPKWKLSIPVPEEFSWLCDPEQFARRAERDAEIYKEIAELAARLSDSRERSKLDHLERCCQEQGLVIAFDGSLISLRYFEKQLRSRGLPLEVLTGEGGAAAKRKAVRRLGLGSDEEGLIALCTDAFSEGLNLQRASCVVHLDTPTVVRVAEQRAGRVDRMDSPHDEITIWWPSDSPAFAPRGRDIFRERHLMVRDLIGANVVHPEDVESEDDHSLHIEKLVTTLSSMSEETNDEESFDAFQEVRRLVEGGHALVPAPTYEAMRTTQAEVVACVSMLESESPWCFLALGGLERAAPRWVYFDDLESPPEFDLIAIPKQLRRRLEAGPASRKPDLRSSELLEKFLQRLKECESRFELLAARKRRALKLLRDELRRAPSSLFDASGMSARSELDLQLFPPNRLDPYPDPASIADAWIRHLRPLIRKAMQDRRPGGRPWRIDDLRRSPHFREALDATKLTEIFRNVPLLRPVEERVVALILGVNEPAPSSPRKA